LRFQVPLDNHSLKKKSEIEETGGVKMKAYKTPEMKFEVKS
jgi:hypothetical protein